MSQAIAREKSQMQRNTGVAIVDPVLLCCSSGEVYQYMIFVISSRNVAGIIEFEIN